MVPAFALDEVVRSAHARTGIPGIAAGVWRDGEVELAAAGVLSLAAADPVRLDTAFRIASVSKPFTASLALACLPLDAELEGALSHTSGRRCESSAPLPDAAQGLFSYSNAGYWAAGQAVARATGTSFEAAMAERVLGPLGLDATGYDAPAAPARGHVQSGSSGHRVVAGDAYPALRRPSGGLWSTAGDLLRFAAHHLGAAGPLADELRATMREPRSPALGAGYGLGWWRRELADGRVAVEHEGSVAGYQSLLLLVPEARLALAVLTNSWRGSGAVRHVVEALGLAPARVPDAPVHAAPDGRYALEAVEATVTQRGGRLAIDLEEVDPVTGAPALGQYTADHLGGGVYGFADGWLMSDRLDFPRPDVARIGWVALPQVDG